MKGLIIHKGKYGATEQYADWLSESLRLPSVTPEEVNSRLLEKTDFLLIGTSIYVGKFQIKDWVNKHVAELEDKKVFFFISCGTPSTEKRKLNEYIQNNVPTEILSNAEVFFLPGRLNLQKLSWWDRFFLKMGASFTAKTPEAKKRMLTEYDHVKKENLINLTNAVRAYSTSSKEMA